MSVLQKEHPLKTIGGNRLLAAYGSLSLRPSTGKRKSAVEMLQETKAFYVKSERVLDAKQEMKHADHLQVSAAPLVRPPWVRHLSDPAQASPPPPPERPPRSTPEKPPPLPLRSPSGGVGGSGGQPRSLVTPSATPSRGSRE
ncbi:WAS/WASL-interacting protein family member 3-like [Pollicipes pollicipes]|uniref:WAS/WASL-interacting protein family member 3-like n=1 Tax=Pollicipes pollicipes TaxID=41117 RepID=UPI001884E796|nr:WAS/WASL-interacting protein family member 3-like [Pollicipes pollicipes]